MLKDPIENIQSENLGESTEVSHASKHFKFNNGSEKHGKVTSSALDAFKYNPSAKKSTTASTITAIPEEESTANIQIEERT